MEQNHRQTNALERHQFTQEMIAIIKLNMDPRTIIYDDKVEPSNERSK